MTTTVLLLHIFSTFSNKSFDHFQRPTVARFSLESGVQQIFASAQNLNLVRKLKRSKIFVSKQFFNWDFPVVRRSTFDEFFVLATLFITTGFTLTSFPGSELKWSCYCCWGSSCWKEDLCAKKFQVQDVLLRCIACCWNRLKYPKSIEL